MAVLRQHFDRTLLCRPHTKPCTSLLLHNCEQDKRDRWATWQKGRATAIVLMDCYSPFLTSSLSCGSVLFMTLSSSRLSAQIISLSCILSVEFQTQGLSHTRRASTRLWQQHLLHTEWSPVYPVGHAGLKHGIHLPQPPKQDYNPVPSVLVAFSTSSLALK